jgi:hypothetical protein
MTKNLNNLTEEQLEDIDVNHNNAMRGEDNYDEMTEIIETNHGCVDIEKMIKSVHELITEWAEFQRNYVYLNVIF